MATEEIVLTRNEAMDKEWQEEIQMISKNHKENTEPAPEPLMVKNKWGKETLNWKIAYSPYRDLILQKYYPDYFLQINNK